jgi:predicted DNA-binding transcriptional regulator YafY
MSKRESIARYNLIIKKLRKQPATLAQIRDYLELESELQDYNFRVSGRTFQRDLEDIRSLYNIDIQYDFSWKVYYIDSDDQPEVNERILEAFDIYNALNLTDRLSDFIHFDPGRPQGTENLFGLLHAIKNRLQIRFAYNKFRDDALSVREVRPYALKEFRNRWYILARDISDEQLKTFSLDRMSDLEITRRHFQLPADFDVNRYFKYCYGIMSPNAESPAEIILSFDPLQGKYIKTLPLHASQQILEDNTKELRIRLTLFVTHDFIMELLSYGEHLKVIQPSSLAEAMKSAFRNALERYLS